MKIFSFGELTKFVRNCIPKFSSKPGKRILISERLEYTTNEAGAIVLSATS